MPHNHRPRCCCEWHPEQPIRNPCPSCVEHGKLARLNMPANTPTNQCPEKQPSTGLRCLREAGHIGGHNTTNDQPWPGECPSCHATGNQPHTDYCRSPLATQVTVSANPSPDHEWCGQPHPMADHHKCRRPAGHRGDHETSHGHRWPDQAQTSQPAATTSQPTAHPRDTNGCRHVVIEFDYHGIGTCRLCGVTPINPRMMNIATTSQPIPTCPCQRATAARDIEHHPLCQWHPANTPHPPTDTPPR